MSFWTSFRDLCSKMVGYVVMLCADLVQYGSWALEHFLGGSGSLVTGSGFNVVGFWVVVL